MPHSSHRRFHSTPSAALTCLAASLTTPAFAQDAPPQISPALINQIQQSGSRNERNILPAIVASISQNNALLNQYINDLNTSSGSSTGSLFNAVTGESYSSVAVAASASGSPAARATMKRLEDLRSPVPQRAILAPLPAGGNALADSTSPPLGNDGYAVLSIANSFAPTLTPTLAQGPGPAMTPADGIAADPADRAAISLEPPRGGLWGRLYGVSGEIDASANASGIDYDGGGVVIGADYRFADPLILGVSVGYSRIESDFTGVSDQDDADIYTLTLYATYLVSERVWIDGSLGYSYSQHNLQRNAPLGQSPEADFDSHSLFATLGTGVNIDLDKPGRWKLQPLASITYSTLWQQSFNEAGGGPFDLSVDGVETSSLRGGVGARLLYEARVSDSLLLLPEVRAGYQHEFLDDNATVASTFANAAPGTGWTADSVNIDRDFLTLGVGVTAHTDRNLSGFLGYDVAFNSDVTEHNLTGGLRYAW